ncbi:zinc-ribbon domain-containing protein, partial [Desulfobotulus sp. H1]
MIITCEACTARFQLDDHYIQPTGTRVRCAKCRHVFTAFREPEPLPFSSEPEDDFLNIEDIQRTDTIPPLTDANSLHTDSEESLPDLAPLSVPDASDTQIISLPNSMKPQKKTSEYKHAPAPVPDSSSQENLDPNFDFDTKTQTSSEKIDEFEFDLDLEPAAQNEIPDMDELKLDFDLEPAGQKETQDLDE